jgi:hypothetical protein
MKLLYLAIGLFALRVSVVAVPVSGMRISIFCENGDELTTLFDI